jgi:hypothetical protein
MLGRAMQAQEMRFPCTKGIRFHNRRPYRRHLHYECYLLPFWNTRHTVLSLSKSVKSDKAKLILLWAQHLQLPMLGTYRTPYCDRDRRFTLSVSTICPPSFRGLTLCLGCCYSQQQSGFWQVLHSPKGIFRTKSASQTICADNGRVGYFDFGKHHWSVPSPTI